MELCARILGGNCPMPLSSATRPLEKSAERQVELAQVDIRNAEENAQARRDWQQALPIAS
jgi:hypothetical protein